MGPVGWISTVHSASEVISAAGKESRLLDERGFQPWPQISSPKVGDIVDCLHFEGSSASEY